MLSEKMALFANESSMFHGIINLPMIVDLHAWSHCA